MRILISPFSKKMRFDKTGKPNPKDYPYWSELIDMLKEDGYYIVQVGIKGEDEFNKADEVHFNLSLDKLEDVAKSCDIRISVDNFFHHFCAWKKMKCLVIFSQSDPLIFGHPTNINMLKSRRWLRKNQTHWWEQCDYRAEAFPSALHVYDIIQAQIKLVS